MGGWSQGASTGVCGSPVASWAWVWGGSHPAGTRQLSCSCTRTVWGMGVQIPASQSMRDAVASPPQDRPHLGCAQCCSSAPAHIPHRSSRGLPCWGGERSVGLGGMVPDSPHGAGVPRAYLEVHQLELEKLSTQIRESKRNSRLVSDAGKPHGVVVTAGTSFSCAPAPSLLLWGHQGPARALLSGCTGLLSCCHALSSPGWMSMLTCYG